MSHPTTPPPQDTDPAKVKAFALLWDVAFGRREPSQAETDLIVEHLTPVLKHNLNCWVSLWSPSDVQDFSDGCRLAFEPTYDQAKDICHNLEDYEHLYSEVNEAVKNELYTLRNSGVNE